MKRLAALAVVTSLSVPGCTTVPGSITPASVASAVAGLCAYQVPLTDIAALLSTSPYIATAEGIATIICQTISAQVITTPPAPVSPVVAAARRRLGAAPPSAVAGTVVVGGVVIHYSR